MPVKRSTKMIEVVMVVLLIVLASAFICVFQSILLVKSDLFSPFLLFNKERGS
jgi:hypothetical protein